MVARRDDPFDDYHRSRWRVSLVRILAVGVSAVVAVGLVSLVTPANPPQARQLTTAVSTENESSGIQDRQLTVAAIAGSEPVTESVEAPALPAPVDLAIEGSAPPLAQPALPNTGPVSWSISVDTRGYQDEIDQCLWVRMDLGGQAPIVGAHNYCGGGMVLEMALGDVVTLTGTDLDGTYRVTDARDARAGDIAATAIEGMAGQVILQTCYWGNGDGVRLVGLTPLPAP